MEINRLACGRFAFDPSILDSIFIPTLSWLVLRILGITMARGYITMFVFAEAVLLRSTCLYPKTSTIISICSSPGSAPTRCPHIVPFTLQRAEMLRFDRDLLICTALHGFKPRPNTSRIRMESFP
jgi:hypothetical protein